MIHPFEDSYVIAGQGKIGLEFLDDLSERDVVIVPVSGGGLNSGAAAMAVMLSGNIKIKGKKLW